MKYKINRLADEDTQITVNSDEDHSLIVNNEHVVDLPPEWRADGNGMPSIGDDIEMEGVECEIEIADVPQDQPRAKEDIYAIVDQYGETHQVESNGEVWTVLVE